MIIGPTNCHAQQETVFFTRIHRAKLEASKHRERERERSLLPENQGGGFNAASMQHQGSSRGGEGGEGRSPKSQL